MLPDNFTFWNSSSIIDCIADFVCHNELALKARLTQYWLCKTTDALKGRWGYSVYTHSQSHRPRCYIGYPVWGRWGVRLNITSWNGYSCFPAWHSTRWRQNKWYSRCDFKPVCVLCTRHVAEPIEIRVVLVPGSFLISYIVSKCWKGH